MNTGKKSLLPPLVLSLIIIFHLCYSVAVYREDSRQEQTLPEEAMQGKLLFQKYNCISCHQIYGLGGYMGPDLTNVISAPGKGAGYTAAYLKIGTARMPDFKLKEEEINSLVAYLAGVSRTGIYPVRDKEFKTEWDGTVEINRGKERVGRRQ